MVRNSTELFLSKLDWISNTISTFCIDGEILEVVRKLYIHRNFQSEGYNPKLIKKHVSDLYKWYDLNIVFLLEKPYILNKKSHLESFELVRNTYLELEGVNL